MTHATHNTNSHDLLAPGLAGIELNHVTERRAAEHDHHQRVAALRAPGHPSRVRRWLGSILISVGNGIAGANAPLPGPESVTAPGITAAS